MKQMLFKLRLITYIHIETLTDRYKYYIKCVKLMKRKTKKKKVKKL